MNVAADLRVEIENTLPRLRALDEASAMRDRGPGKWVRKEILGHLIDSAANNHQRFVRARLADRLATTCVVGDKAPATLEWLMQDYVRHMRHHLAQIVG